MTRADFTTCGRNILPAPNRSPTTFIPGHQRTFDDLDRLPAAGLDDGAQLLGVGLGVVVDALHQRMGDALGDGQLAPLLVDRFGLHPLAGELRGDLEQALRRVRAAVEDDVFDALAQSRIELVVGDEGAGIHDAHVHAGRDRVEQEDGVNGLAHRVIAAEGEGDVGNAAGHQRARQVLP